MSYEPLKTPYPHPTRDALVVAEHVENGKTIGIWWIGSASLLELDALEDRSGRECYEPVELVGLPNENHHPG